MGKTNKGNIFQIQRFSIHDGQGIRTSVFLKGCPLRCYWCHNPEGLNLEDDLMLTSSLCISCGMCEKICKSHAISVGDNGAIINRSRCNHCFECVENCPSQALSKIGTEYTPEQIINIVKRDNVFYRNSGGGITLTGGEPLMQHEFAFEVLALCNQENIHTAIETSLFANGDIVKKMLSLTKQVIIDCKAFDETLHIKGTSVSNKQILENIAYTLKNHDNVLVRIPIIPNFNNNKEELERIYEFLSQQKNGVKVELMPYHSFGTHKYKQLSIDTNELTPPSDSEMEKWGLLMKNYPLNQIN